MGLGIVATDAIPHLNSKIGIVQAAEQTEGDFTYLVNEDGTATVKSYTGTSKDIVIPEKLGGHTVTVIGEPGINSAFAPFKGKGLTSVKLPDTVVKLSNNVFEDNNLTSIELPDTLKEISYSAFADNNLTSIELPKGIEVIGGSAFLRNQIESVTIPGSVTTVGSVSFAGNNLKEVKLEEGVKVVGYEAFYGGGFAEHSYQNNITKLILPDSLERISEKAFSQNSNLKEVNLPNNIKEISGFNQTGIEEVELPQGLEVIGVNAFFGSELKNISIPDTVNEIKNGAFRSNSIEEVVIPKNVVVIGNNSFEGNIINKVVFSEGLKEIGVASFKGNDLSEVSFPESLEEIDKEAFYNNSIEKINVKGVETRIESNAFDRNQTTASDIIFYAPNPSVAKNFAETRGYTFMEYTKPVEPEVPEEIPGTGGNEGENGGSTGGGTDADGDTSSSMDAGFNIGSGLFELEASKIKSFGNIEMPAETTEYTTSFEAPFNVKDFSGKQLGWRVDVTASQFEVDLPNGEEGHKLPVGTLELSPLKGIKKVGNGTRNT